MRASPAAVALLAGVAVSKPSPIRSQQATETDCHDVHIMVARGSWETYDVDENRQDRLLVPAICDGRPNCGYEDIIYPAILENNTISCDGSENEGVLNGLRQLEEYSSRCPDSQIVLTGYSQGAQVVGDMIASGGPPSCDAGNVPLDPDTKPGNMIAAAVFLADTRRTGGQPYNYGAAGIDESGRFPRSDQDIQALNKFETKIASFCLAGDDWCTSGSNHSAHGVAVETYYQEAAQFVNHHII